MKNSYKLLPLAALISLAGCNKFLDRQPLDSYSSETFLANKEEMELALNGVYASTHWIFPNNTPLLFAIETTTDLAIKRSANAEDLIAMGDAGPFLVNNAVPSSAWSQAYKLIVRANQQLKGMELGKDNTAPADYGRIRAEALTLRAWGYYHIMGWFGDPVYFREPLLPAEYETQVRTPMVTVAADLYADLDEAAALFEVANTPAVQEMGKVNWGVALGLKAKLAMLMKDYAIAADAAGKVINSGLYGLNPRYTDLFILSGQQANVNREILFNQPFPTDILDPQNWLAVLTIPRQVGTSQSSHFPTQQLVDKYEATDGKRIDESAVYDPAAPSKNRDNRLRWTLYMPGDTMVHNTAKAPSGNYVQPKERTIYNVHSNVRYKWNWITNRFDTLAGNIDWIDFRNSPWFAGATGSSGGVGYVWRKYTDSTQYSWETKTGYILMRYADILLTYAEAKIELNQTDETVLSAINQVRVRAGMPTVETAPQAALRQVVRRERAVEFAGEGLRLIDLRRWDLIIEAMNGPVVGVALNPANPPATPVFDENDIPDYSGSLPLRLNTRNQVRINTNRHKLWPIPLGEIDKNPNLVQNEGWD